MHSRYTVHRFSSPSISSVALCTIYWLYKWSGTAEIQCSCVSCITFLRFFSSFFFFLFFSSSSSFKCYFTFRFYSCVLRCISLFRRVFCTFLLMPSAVRFSFFFFCFVSFISSLVVFYGWCVGKNHLYKTQCLTATAAAAAVQTCRRSIKSNRQKKKKKKKH